MKTIRVIPLVIAAISVTSCFRANKGIAEHHDIVYTEEAFDKEALDKYFLENSEFYPSYQTLKGNCPDLLDRVKCIESAGGFYASGLSMFRFSTHENGFLGGETFLLDKCYDGDYYFHLGQAFGGYGVTDFVRRQGNAGFWIFFLYSFGSGIHQTRVGAYEIGRHRLYSFDTINLEDNKDFTLVVDEQRNIDVYEATINAQYDENYFATFTITKNKLVVDNIDDYKKTEVQL